MAKDPAFPFYASDWLGSNKRAMMTLGQQGAYLLLLCRQWSDPTCSLPDDDGALAGLSELSEGWLTIGCPLVRDCFPKHPYIEGRLANQKLLELRAERDEWLEKSSKGGKTSAAKRRAKAKQARGYGKMKGGTTTLGTNSPTKGQPNGNTPSPSPSSLPPTVVKVNQKSNRSDDVLAVIAHYRTHHPQSLKSPTKDSKEWKLIWARMVEGSTVDDLREAIDGCHRTPHNLGENERNQKYLGLALIMRDASQVQRFMEAPAMATGLSAKERRGLQATQQWLEDDQ